MRLYVLVGLLCGALFIQGTVLELVDIWGVKPDLLFIIIAFHAFLRGPREGALLGFFGGLFGDLATGSYIGLNALTLMLTGYLVGLMESKLYKDSRIMVFFLVAVSAFITQALKYFILFALEVNISPGVAFLKIIIPTALYTAALTPFFYGKFHRSTTKGILSSGNL